MLDAADTIVVFTGNYSELFEWIPPAWIAEHPNVESFAAMVWGVPGDDPDFVAHVTQYALNMHVGWVFVEEAPPSSWAKDSMVAPSNTLRAAVTELKK